MGVDGPQGQESIEHSPSPGNWQWPQFFPECCPPDDAELTSNAVYRLVRHIPPMRDDFQPWCIENGKVDKSKPCMSCAISVFDDLEDIRKMQRRVPSQRAKAVAKGTLRPELGVSKSTGKRTHRSWWTPEGVDPSPVFSIVAPPLDEGDSND